MRKIVFFCCLFFCFVTSATAIELAGVQIPDTLGTDLTLNGAGIRSKFFFKIYIAELYLEHPAHTTKEVLESPGRKRMVMHLLYDKVTGEQLVEGWNDGFGRNLSDEELKQLTTKIVQFNTMFPTVHRGEDIVFDYIPGTGTVVTIAGVEKGVVEGAAFNRALLSIWLGKDPVGEDLRDALLGLN